MRGIAFANHPSQFDGRPFIAKVTNAVVLVNKIHGRKAEGASGATERIGQGKERINKPFNDPHKTRWISIMGRKAE